jgi:hypothetical protein
VLPALRSIKDFEGALVLRRHAAQAQIEIEVLTFWRSMNTIHRFAGPDSEHAVVENEAKGVLRSFARRVQHFELLLDARPTSPTRNQRRSSKTQHMKRLKSR